MGLDLLDRRVESLVSSLKAGGLFGDDAHDTSTLEARKDDRECGEGIGSCPQDKCCSSVGYCGTTPNHCYSPGCDYKHGPACPENQHPDGKNTSSIPRAKFGSVPYGGTGVYKCKNPGTVALTFDDGPHKDFTDHILDISKSYNAKATFFITGNNINKGQIDKTEEHINAIKRMNTEGHQIASHTWTHLNLTQISPEDRKNQIWNVEMALNNIVGRIPTYLRPPYSSCDADCQQDMSDLGYHLIYFDVDTDDYQQLNASRIQNSKDWFKGNITKNDATPKTNDWLTISHDIIEQTANNLTEYMLSTLTQLGYKAVTVGECLGDPEENWYRQFGDAVDRKGNSSTLASPNSSQSSLSPSSGTSTPVSSSGSSSSSSKTSGGAAPEQTTSLASQTFQNAGLLLFVFPLFLLSISVATAS
ncbi:Chitin deacetylase [Ascochyta lentis]